MKIIFSLIIMSISLPSFAEISNNEKTAWTGGYIYGFAATLCEGKRLGYINESEFIKLRKNTIDFYRDNLESFAYSPDSSPALYKLMDLNELNQVCKSMADNL